MTVSSIQSSNGVTHTQGTGGDVGLTDDATPPPLMPSPIDQMTSSGDVGQMIAALLLKTSNQSRQIARDQKQAAMAAEDAAEQKKLADMDAQAEAKFIGGMASGIGEAAGGCAAFVSPFVSSDKWSTALKGGSEGAPGVGKGISAYSDLRAAGHEEDVARDDHAVEQAKRNVESASDDRRDAADLANKAIDFLKEYQTAKNDAAAAAIHRA